jgi:hypothetical protein
MDKSNSKKTKKNNPSFTKHSHYCYIPQNNSKEYAVFSIRPNKVLAANSTSIDVITEVLCAIHSDIDEDSISAFKILTQILTGTYTGKHPRRGNWMRALVELKEKEYADIPLINELITENRKVIAAIDKCQNLIPSDIRRCLKKVFPNEHYKVERYARQEIDLANANQKAKAEEKLFRRGASTIIQTDYIGDVAPIHVASVIALIQKDVNIDIIPAIFLLNKLLHNINANLHVCQSGWVTELRTLRYYENIVNPEMDNLLEHSSHISQIHKYDRSAGLFNRHENNTESLECAALRLEHLNGSISLIKYAAPALLAAIALTALILRYTIPGRVACNWAYHRFNMFNEDQHRDEGIDDVEEQGLLRTVNEEKSRLSPSSF